MHYMYILFVCNFLLFHAKLYSIPTMMCIFGMLLPSAGYFPHMYHKYQCPVCVRVCICVRTRANVLLTAGLLDRLHSDDPVCACGFLHPRGLRPDDCVGQRQTPQLLKGVQRLSNPALLHTPLHPVEPGRENNSRSTHPLPH